MSGAHYTTCHGLHGSQRLINTEEAKPYDRPTDLLDRCFRIAVPYFSRFAGVCSIQSEEAPSVRFATSQLSFWLYRKNQ